MNSFVERSVIEFVVLPDSHVPYRSRADSYSLVRRAHWGVPVIDNETDLSVVKHLYLLKLNCECDICYDSTP